MYLLAARVKPLIIGVFLIFALLSCPVYAATQEASTLLTITNVSASKITSHEARISWKTNGNATSKVFYDTEFHEDIDDYARYTDEDTKFVSKHSITLTTLSSSTIYHYRVKSLAIIDGTEFVAISQDYSFITKGTTRGRWWWEWLLWWW